MSTNLAVSAPHHAGELVHHASPTVAELLQMAELFAGSGMFKDARTVAEAFVKIQAGAEMGVAPFQSMSGVHVIQGKPVVGAQLLASLLDSHPAYSYRVTWDHDADGLETACSVTIAKNGTERGTSRFSLADASRAGLMNNATWTKYPGNMLFARAMSNAVRWYAGAVTGGAPVYVDGEVEELAPVDLGELAKKPSEIDLPRLKITREEQAALVAAAKQAGLVATELKALLLDRFGSERQADLYQDQLVEAFNAIEAAGLDDISAVTDAEDAQGTIA